MDKNTGHVIHEGADRRSILPNCADFNTQLTVGISVAVATLLIGALITFIGYCGDNAYKGILTSITDLKTSQQSSLSKIWLTINGNKSVNQSQYDWVIQQCCQSAKTPPPIIPGG